MPLVCDMVINFICDQANSQEGRHQGINIEVLMLGLGVSGRVRIRVRVRVRLEGSCLVLGIKWGRFGKLIINKYINI